MEYLEELIVKQFVEEPVMEQLVDQVNEPIRFAVKERCKLQLEPVKTEIWAWDKLPPSTPQNIKRPGVKIKGEFIPGMVCYRTPIVRLQYVKPMLWNKATKAVQTAKTVCSMLRDDTNRICGWLSTGPWLRRWTTTCPCATP